MTRRVVLTGPAERDTLSNHEWWGLNRSNEQADRWLVAAYTAMFALNDDATAAHGKPGWNLLLRESDKANHQLARNRFP